MFRSPWKSGPGRGGECLAGRGAPSEDSKQLHECDNQPDDAVGGFDVEAGRFVDAMIRACAPSRCPIVASAWKSA